MKRGRLFLPAVFAMGALLSSCAGTLVITGSTITPSLVSISPSTIPAGSGSFTLTLSGTGLTIASQVHFGSDVLMPKSATPANCPGVSNCDTIAVTVPAKDVAIAGPVNVSVTNGPLSSGAVVFGVTEPTFAGAPILVNLSPMAVPVGGPSFSLEVTALDASAGAMVNFGSLALTPAGPALCLSASACTLTVQVPSSAIATARPVSVSMTNPGPSGGASNALGFLVIAPGQFPIEQSVSNSNPPAPANAPSTHASVSAAGEDVAFDSTATNLASGTPAGHSQVYLRRNCFGATPNCVPQTTLVSAAPNGVPGAGGLRGSEKPAISPDGRFIVYQSDDTNLVPGPPPPAEQIYLFDTCRSILGPAPNCTPGTTRVSAAPSGAAGNAPSTNPAVSAFGVFIAFESSASNLASGPVPANVRQIYVRLSCQIPFLGPVPACQPTTELLSVDAQGSPGDKDSTHPSIDPLGQFVSFQSLADHLVAGVAGNGFEQIYVRGTCRATTPPNPPNPLFFFGCPAATTLASGDASGKLGAGDSVAPQMVFAGAGVVFATRAPNLLPANTSNEQILLRTLCLDTLVPSGCAPATLVVSVDANGLPGQGDSSRPSVGGRGVIGFTSLASLVAGVTGQPAVAGQQVYATPPCPFAFSNPALCAPRPILVSADASGAAMGGDHAAVDPSGFFVAFSSAGGSGASAGIPEIYLAAPFFSSPPATSPRR